MVAVSASVVAALTGSAVAAPPQTRAGTQYFVDCHAGNDAAPGTAPRTAWRSIDRVNQAAFGPGDSIVFRRGTTCVGVLQPKGSGTAAAPIKLGAYGSGVRPKIVAPNARAAVYLYNVEGWEIRDLDVSNPGPSDGTPRVGIYIVLEDFGIGHHYIIDDVYVHDVPGCDCLDAGVENAGGILFAAHGSTVPTGFDKIRVRNSLVSNVDNIGIGTLSRWSKRDLYPGGLNSFVPITDVRITRNLLTSMGGDGVLVMNGVDSMTEHNKVDGFGLRTAVSHAAIIAFNADRAVMQHNEITGGAAMPPSFAISVDAATKDTIYQYNYSHDNDGPFILFCAPPGSYADGAIVRYNISSNDHDNPAWGIPIVAAGGCPNPITNSKFYNNVIYGPTATMIVGAEPQTSVAFSNNIFVGRPEGTFIMDPVGVYDHNLYHNITTIPPSDANAVIGDPLFVGPLATGDQGFRLGSTSPALNTGAAIPNNGGRDYYGYRMPAGTVPNIGIDESDG